MSHARQQVRDALVTLLNSAPSSYRRAYNTRIPPMQQVWPYLLVWTDSETVTEQTIHPSSLQLRDMNLAIEARVQLPQRETEVLETRMDTVAAEIETKLKLSTMQTSLAHVTNFVLTDTRMELAVDQDDVPAYGAITLNYVISYTTVEGSPETLV